jgi:hypothetical protein
MKPWAFVLWASLAWHGSSKSDAADCEAQVTALHAKMRAVTDCYSVLGGLTGKEADDTDFTQVRGRKASWLPISLGYGVREQQRFDGRFAQAIA